MIIAVVSLQKLHYLLLQVTDLFTRREKLSENQAIEAHNLDIADKKAAKARAVRAYELDIKIKKAAKKTSF